MGVNTRPFVTVQRAVAIGYPALGLAWLAGVAWMISSGWRLGPIIAFVTLLLVVFAAFRCPRCGVPLGVTMGLVPRAPRKCLRCGLDFYNGPFISRDNAQLRREWTAVHGRGSAGFAANLKWLLFGRLPPNF